MAGSPAVALGLAVGDKVRVINGQPVGNDYWTSDQWRWPFGAAGTEVELNLSDGRTIKLTLADFY
jgi:C-terminal processing protease CtpA/Prc